MPERPQSGLALKLRAQRARHLRRPKPIRVLIVAAGFVVTLGGIVLLVLPGPAFVIIPIGLALLALEFAWAERALEKALDHAETAKDAAGATSPTQRLLAIVAGVLAVAAAVAAVVLWDIPFLPF